MTTIKCIANIAGFGIILYFCVIGFLTQVQEIRGYTMSKSTLVQPDYKGMKKFMKDTLRPPTEVEEGVVTHYMPSPTLKGGWEWKPEVTPVETFKNAHACMQTVLDLTRVDLEILP